MKNVKIRRLLVMFLTTSLLCGMTTVAAEPAVDNKAGEVENVLQQEDCLLYTSDAADE